MDMSGWDTIFAESLVRANAVLAQNPAGIPASLTSTVSGALGTFTIDVTLGSWQLQGDSSGAILDVLLPIAGGTITTPEGSIPLAGCNPLMQLSLRFVQATGQQTLMFDIEQAGSVGDAPQPGFATPHGFLGSPPLDPDLQPILLDGLAAALVQDAAAITFAFASIQPSSPGQSWLTPPNNEVASFGGYLTVFGTSDQTLPPAVLDPAIYAGEVDAAFAVSADLVFTNELVPALCAVLPGASFAVTGEPAQASLTPNVTVQLASCEVGAITYHPCLDALTLTSADGGIAVSAEGGCDLYGDCSMTFTVKAINQFRFDQPSQQYSFASDPAPSVAHSTHIPWWYAMGGAVVIVIAETVASVVGNSIAALVGRAVAANGVSAEPPTTIHFAGIQSFVTSAAFWNTGGLLLQAGEQAPASS